MAETAPASTPTPRQTKYGFITNDDGEDSRDGFPQQFPSLVNLTRGNYKNKEQLVRARQELVLHLTSLMFGCAFMIGGAIFAALAAIIKESASCAQSAAICGVAALHYSAMKNVVEAEAVPLMVNKLFESQGVKENSDENPMIKYGFQALSTHRLQLYLQYSDWLTTFPLLAMKLVMMARSGSGSVDEWLASGFMLMSVGLIGLLMIVAGVTSVIVSGDWGLSTKGNWRRRAFRIAMMFVGMVCLVMLYVVIYTTAEQSNSHHGAAIYIFTLVWIGYPAIAGLEMTCGPLIPAWRTLWITLLDVISKAFLAIYVSTDVLAVTTAVV